MAQGRGSRSQRMKRTRERREKIAKESAKRRGFKIVGGKAVPLETESREEITVPIKETGLPAGVVPIAISRSLPSGGSVIITKSGLVTEKDAGGRTIRQFNVSPSDAQRVITSRPTTTPSGGSQQLTNEERASLGLQPQEQDLPPPQQIPIGAEAIEGVEGDITRRQEEKPIQPTPQQPINPLSLGVAEQLEDFKGRFKEKLEEAGGGREFFIEQLGEIKETIKEAPGKFRGRVKKAGGGLEFSKEIGKEILGFGGEVSSGAGAVLIETPRFISDPLTEFFTGVKPPKTTKERAIDLFSRKDVQSALGVSAFAVGGQLIPKITQKAVTGLISVQIGRTIVDPSPTKFAELGILSTGKIPKVFGKIPIEFKKAQVGETTFVLTQVPGVGKRITTFGVTPTKKFGFGIRFGRPEADFGRGSTGLVVKKGKPIKPGTTRASTEAAEILAGFKRPTPKSIGFERPISPPKPTDFIKIEQVIPKPLAKPKKVKPIGGGGVFVVGGRVPKSFTDVEKEFSVGRFSDFETELGDFGRIQSLLPPGQRRRKKITKPTIIFEFGQPTLAIPVGTTKVFKRTLFETGEPARSTIVGLRPEIKADTSQVAMGRQQLTDITLSNFAKQFISRQRTGLRDKVLKAQEQQLKRFTVLKQLPKTTQKQDIISRSIQGSRLGLDTATKQLTELKSETALLQELKLEQQKIQNQRLDLFNRLRTKQIEELKEPPPDTFFDIDLPELKKMTRKRRKGKPKKKEFGSFAPSLVGRELFFKKGFTIPKAPKLTVGIGIRPVVKGTFPIRRKRKKKR